MAPLIKEQIIKLKIAKRQILVEASNEAVNFFTENFRRQGFLDRSVKKWDKRKGNVDPGRGVLIGKANARGRGSRLSRSIKRLSISSRRAVVGVSGRANQYAGVHNYGLRSGRKPGFTQKKRQFVGRSKTLDKKTLKLINRRVNKIF